MEKFKDQKSFNELLEEVHERGMLKTSSTPRSFENGWEEVNIDYHQLETLGYIKEANNNEQ